MNINAMGAADAVQLAARNLLMDAVRSKPRGLETMELMNTSIEIENPCDCVVAFDVRKRSTWKYLMAELKWYFHGDLRVNGGAIDIGKYASTWAKIADGSGRVNSNYGYLAFKKLPKQFEWCYYNLRDDPFTRRAVINYNAPEHKDWESKDFPCTMYSMFYIRDNKLHQTTAMRSQDLIYGFTYDVTYFALVQQLLHAMLVQSGMKDLEMGAYHHHVGSLHVYQRHYDIAEKIAAASVEYPAFPSVTADLYSDIMNGTSRSCMMRFIDDQLFESQDN